MTDHGVVNNDTPVGRIDPWNSPGRVVRLGELAPWARAAVEALARQQQRACMADRAPGHLDGCPGGIEEGSRRDSSKDVTNDDAGGPSVSDFPEANR